MDKFVGGVQLSNTNVQALLFADDIWSLRERKTYRRINLEMLKEVINKWEMRLHLGKTKVIVVCRV